MSGVEGGIFHWSMILVLTLGAALTFIHFWRVKLLSFDEEPKSHVFKDQEHENF